MKISKLLTKAALYLLCCSFFIFYSGKNQIFSFYAEDPAAFEPKNEYSFSFALLPKLQFQSFYYLNISAQAYLVMDLDSFTPILSKNLHKKMHPASIIKLATALVAYKHYDLGQKLTVGKVINEELKMGLVKNERMNTLNLLYGTLVYSANDAAYTLAENYPGGVEAFVKEMNSLANKLGMQNTHFSDSIGFDSNKQYSTAYDLALLAREFTNNSILTTITSTKAITVSDNKFERFHTLTNINELLGEIPHLGGLKTGTTELAGQNLISYYRFNNRPLLIVILKSEDRFNDTRKLINLINTNLVYEQIQ